MQFYSNLIHQILTDSHDSLFYRVIKPLQGLIVTSYKASYGKSTHAVIDQNVIRPTNVIRIDQKCNKTGKFYPTVYSRKNAAFNISRTKISAAHAHQIVKKIRKYRKKRETFKNNVFFENAPRRLLIFVL